jgi:hypothetical protein
MISSIVRGNEADMKFENLEKKIDVTSKELSEKVNSNNKSAKNVPVQMTKM